MISLRMSERTASCEAVLFRAGNPVFEADTVILSTGLRVNHAETFDHLAQTVVYAGDRKAVSNIENAMRTAYAAALQV